MKLEALVLTVLASLSACSTVVTGRCRIDVTNLPPATGGGALQLNMVSEGASNPVQVVITNNGTQACYFESATARIGTIQPGTSATVTFTASATGLAFAQSNLAAPLYLPPTFDSVGVYSPTSQTLHPAPLASMSSAAHYGFTVCGLSSEYAISVEPAQTIGVEVCRTLPSPGDGRNTLFVVSQAAGDVQAIELVNYGPKAKSLVFGDPGSPTVAGLPASTLVRLELKPAPDGTMTGKVTNGTAVPVVAHGKYDPGRGASLYAFSGPPGHAYLVASYRGLFTEVGIKTTP
jgi:hypothetical protein